MSAWLASAAAYDEDGYERDARPVEVDYDRLIVATGSRPFVPPIEGMGIEGTYSFRTLDDCSRIAAYARRCSSAVVIGGGLLGLEAARGLVTHDLEVTVVEAAPHLMPAQLDADAGAELRRSIETLGIRVRTGCMTRASVGARRVEAVELKGGERLACQMVVVSAGIRPIVELARDCDLHVRRAIVAIVCRV